MLYYQHVTDPKDIVIFRKGSQFPTASVFFLFSSVFHTVVVDGFRIFHHACQYGSQCTDVDCDWF